MIRTAYEHLAGYDYSHMKPPQRIDELNTVILLLANLTERVVELIREASDAARNAAEGQVETINDHRLGEYLTKTAETLSHALAPTRHCQQALLSAAEHTSGATARLNRLRYHQPREHSWRSPDRKTFRPVSASQAISDALRVLNKPNDEYYQYHRLLTVGDINRTAYGLIDLGEQIKKIIILLTDSAQQQAYGLDDAVDDPRLYEHLQETTRCLNAACRAIRYSSLTLSHAHKQIGRVCMRLRRFKLWPTEFFCRPVRP